MRKFLAALILTFPLAVFSQNSIVQEGEFGFGLGAGHYFGDLNTRAKLNRPKMAANIFFRKNFGNYIALRISGTFAQLGYSDVYNGHNEFMRRRNLTGRPMLPSGPVYLITTPMPSWTARNIFSAN